MRRELICQLASNSASLLSKCQPHEKPFDNTVTRELINASHLYLDWKCLGHCEAERRLLRDVASSSVGETNEHTNGGTNQISSTPANFYIAFKRHDGWRWSTMTLKMTTIIAYDCFFLSLVNNHFGKTGLEVLFQPRQPVIVHM